MVATGEGKDRHGATNREPLLMPRQSHIPGWVAVPGWQGLAAEKRRAMVADHARPGGYRCPRGREGAWPGPGLMRAERGNLLWARIAGAACAAVR